MNSVLYASDDIARIVQHIGLNVLMDKAIDGISDACREFDAKTYSVPNRDGFSYGNEHPGLMEWMPAMKHGDKVVIKVVGYHPNNPKQNKLPTILSTLLAFDTASGHLISAADGTFITALRTGAASAVATKVFASPQSRVLGLIGAGAQAITQLHALSRVFEFDTVMINDIDADACNSFHERAAGLGLENTKFCIESIENILTVADIICTATSIGVGQGPLFPDSSLPSSVHINAVGSDFPGKLELPAPLLRRSLVCPDFREQAVCEGECQQLSTEEIGPDLATIVKNDKQYQSYRNSMTVFDSTGWALEDYVVMEILNELGTKLGCGTAFRLESISDDPKNPYGFLKPACAELRQIDSKKLRWAN